MKTGSATIYLKSFNKVVEILFNNLETANNFNVKFIQNALKVM